jgi:hypothetical protein
MGGEFEVEDLRVLRDALTMGRLGDDRDTALNAPAQKDLGRASPEAVCDALDHRVAQECAGAQRAVCLERDATFVAGVKERLAIGRRVELNLIDQRCDRRTGDELIELVGSKLETPIARA